MADRWLVDILTGRHRSSERQELHDALDVLLDAQENDGGELFAARYWDFIGLLAEGRGITAEIEESATRMLVAHSTDDRLAQAFTEDKAEDFWRAWHWAVLFKLLQRLEVPAKFGRSEGILPKDFLSVAVRALALNGVQEGGQGREIDLLGMNTSKLSTPD